MVAAARHIVLSVFLILSSVSVTPSLAPAQTVTMMNGRAVAFDSLPMVAKFQGRMKLPASTQGQNIPWLAIMTTPSFCPSAWSITSGESDIERAEAVCSAISRARLEDYTASTRTRCRCERALEGSGPRSLRAISPVVEDPDYYTIIILAVTRQAGRERLRGFLAMNASGAFRIFNENRQAVCTGKGLSESGDIQFSCFGGAVTARGSYRVIAHNTSTSPSYGIGSFQLSDGSRLNIAVNIIDRDLLDRHPRFPD